MKQNGIMGYRLVCLFLGSICFSVQIHAESSIIGVCFFDDHTESSTWGDEKCSTKTAFIKALSTQAHIFITPQIWQSFTSFRRKCLTTFKAYNIDDPLQDLHIAQGNVYHTQDNIWLGTTQKFNFMTHQIGLPEVFCFNPHAWELYDTQIGLLYLHKKDIPTTGIPTEQFIRLNTTGHYKPHTNTNHWSQNVHTLFDVSLWNISKEQSKTYIYLHGHGSKRKKPPAYELACGMSALQCAHVLKFFNDELHVDLVGIKSCYWSAQRILELMQDAYGYQQLNFHLFTLISMQEKTWNKWLHPISTYSRSNQVSFSGQYQTFSSALYYLTSMYTNNITPGITALIHSIDDLHCHSGLFGLLASCIAHKQLNKTPSFIPAGSKKPQFVKKGKK